MVISENNSRQIGKMLRKEVQIQTINRRRDYNQGPREPVNAT
ncbi:hypothetical protein ACFLWS_07370 [Chloroflexota bacterium]